MENIEEKRRKISLFITQEQYQFLETESYFTGDTISSLVRKYLNRIRAETIETQKNKHRNMNNITVETIDNETIVSPQSSLSEQDKKLIALAIEVINISINNIKNNIKIMEYWKKIKQTLLPSE